MFQRFQSCRAKCIIFQCTQRRWFSGDRHLLVKNSCRILKQKTKVETIALPYLQTLPSHPIARHYSAVGGHKKTSSLFINLYSDFSPRMLNNFHHHRALSGRLFFRNTPKSFNFARSKKPNTRQNSDRSSKRTQTDSTESTFSREWKQRKTGAYYILAAFILTGGTVYYYQHYSKVSESSCETEVDVPEKETRKKYGWKKTADTLNSLQLQEAITQATDLCQRVKDESGAPGLVVAVSVDGRPVWTEGMGYADIENRLPCKPESVICIASISKPLTMTAIAKAVENGDLDLDKPVQVYVPQYPENTLDGKKVTMTTRQLVSHLGGVRHYSKKYISKTPPPQSDDSASASESEMKKKKEEKESTSSEKASTSNQPAEFKQEEEYYIKDKYESTEAALALFKDDPLVHKPGSKFLYTTHAWTLLAAVLEGATKTKYPVLIRQLFHDLGLSSTYLNDSEPLIYHRVRNYIRNKKGRLVNAPYVDCSYKYAGGGILSTMSDLVHFGDAMLYSYQYQGLSTNEKETKAVTVKKADSPSYNNNNNNNNNNNKTTGTPLLPGYLQASTVEELWTPVKLAKMNRTTFYGMGWMMPAKKTPTIGFGRKDRMYVYHTGGAVGASSILLILPSKNVAAGGSEKDSAAAAVVAVLPRGVCVAIAVNMIAVDLHKTALQIAQLFEEVV